MTTTEPSTELALIPDNTGEIVEAQPLSTKDAKALDKRIRATGDRAVKSHTNTLKLFDELTELLTQARDGEIHKALGLKSWTAYVSDAVNLEVPQREDRKALTLFFSGQGMSQRAIATALGVSQKTIDRDLEGETTESGATVTSLDGAERPKNGKAKPEVDYIEAEVVEPPEESQSDEPMTAADIVEAFNDETVNCWTGWSELKELMAEPKWANARKRVAKANLNHITEIITGLQAIVDDLMTG